MRAHEARSAGLRHLAWIPVGAGVGFGLSFVFGDLVAMPVDLYYLVYFAGVVGFLAFYVHRTRFPVRTWAARRILPALVLGVAGGLVLSRGVLTRPPTAPLHGTELAWALLWRGLLYGSVDGLLLVAFPWVVTWRALEAERGRGRRKLAATVGAWAAILLVTTAYHLGYADFRSRRVVQPNIGATITALPTLVTANPIAGPMSHVFLHVTAVLHAPETDLFLPPHRD
jgi:hypothetical protein